MGDRQSISERLFYTAQVRPRVSGLGGGRVSEFEESSICVAFATR